MRFLEGLGYEVLRARDAGLSTASDEALLDFACRKGYVLLTRDKGFGQLVFLRSLPHTGVVLLRIEPNTLGAVHQELVRFLSKHGGEDFGGWFVVIEPGRHRIRRQ